MTNDWYVKENGGKGNLVGIASKSSNWFIAEEVLPEHAPLIAAAPDMAEALKAVLEELLDQEKMPIMSNVYRKAQAAYHKATGEYAEAYKATAKGK